MTRLEPVSFESPAAKEVYKQVERNGPLPIDEVKQTVSLSDEEFRTQVDRLTENGFIEKADGRLELGLDLGESEDHETDDFDYVIRPAAEDDLDELVDVIEGIAAKKTYVVANELATELRYDDTVIRHNSLNSRVFFVATTDDEIIGWSHLDLPLVEYLRSTAQLTVGIREAYRGYIVGTELLNRALDWAEENDYKKVYNNVAETNVRAISFLESRGWKEEGVREDHYTIGHKQVDEVMMAYTF